MKLKKENLFLILLILILVLIYICTEMNPNIIFMANILVCIIICTKAKFSLFSIKSILINYVLIAVAFQYNTGESYGLLELGLFQLRYEQMCMISLIYNIILLFYIVNSKTLEREEEILKYHLEETNIFSVVCAILAIIFSIIAFPTLNFNLSSETRFQALLPGNAWNHMAIISLIFAIPKFKQSIIVKVSYLFCILWFLLHGERVDMIGLMLATIIMLIVNGKDTAEKILSFKNIKYYIVAFIIVVILVYIGEYRNGNTEIGLSEIYKKILVQNTAADVGYVYNSSILYVEDNGFLYGKSYLLYLLKLIPFISVAEYDVVAILQNMYYTAGGILILSEPYMNFGIIGVIVFALLEFGIINIIVKRKKDYNFFLYLFLLATQFRVTWYGIVYIEKGIVYIIPIMYLLYIKIRQIAKKEHKK